jgi:phage N-6-adenine-methyltransferase
MNVHFEQTPPDDVVFHDYANLFPMLQGEALDRLREDIREHGVREPVVFIGNAILDGRNRYMCARDLGIEYPRTEFGGDDPLSFVISHNLHRRHLTESQRASIAARVANMPRGGAVYRTANLPTENESGLSLSEQAAPRPPLTSNADAADMLNVSERSVRSARKVHDTAPPEVSRAVDEGRMSVSLASQVADLPPEDQEAVTTAAPDKVKDVAREAVKRAHVSNNSGNNEWYTPAAIIDAARAVMGGFDLDPATSEIANRTVGAARIFTQDDDGLKQEWPVGRIWMNPPYAQPLMGQFASRFAAEVKRGSEGVVLVNNATETAWFQEMAEECSAICFPRARIKFLDPDGNPGAPLQGQAIIYCGSDADAFEEAFHGFGLVVRHG